MSKGFGRTIVADSMTEKAGAYEYLFHHGRHLQAFASDREGATGSCEIYDVSLLVPI
jgi:hypothetical protein